MHEFDYCLIVETWQFTEFAVMGSFVPSIPKG